ncbi:hypothetical protein J3F84DRAFT_50019 [Trichoderma pleuroticola]
MKTTLAEGNLPRYGQLNSIPVRSTTRRLADTRLATPWTPKGGATGARTSTSIASASTKWCVGTVRVLARMCTGPSYFPRAASLDHPKMPRGSRLAEHGTAWRPVDVVPSVATRARNCLFLESAPLPPFPCRSSATVHSTLVTGQEWRMVPWRDKDALDALDGTIPTYLPR